MELLMQRIAKRELLRRAYEEELPGKPTVTKRREWQEVEELEVKEWTEQVEVAEEQQAQLLEIVLDVSPSMNGNSINMAIALALAVIGVHMDDDSRYIYRAFADYVSDAIHATTKAQKAALARALMTQDNDVGGGTNILKAITAAATDVRGIARASDRPEILLITDGSDRLSSEDVYRAVGNDVIMHVVVIGQSNYSLRERGSTYYELHFDTTVTGRGK
jgi:uncharacterized protein with von Willebrand factor type A (vWA) domain